MNLLILPSSLKSEYFSNRMDFFCLLVEVLDQLE